jgi:hypothetical protein
MSRLRRPVARPAFSTLIRSDQRDVLGHGFIHEAMETAGAGFGDDLGDDVALAGDSADHRDLAGLVSLGLPVLGVPVPVLPADV